MRIELVSRDRGSPQRRIVLDKLPVVIGRSPNADVHLDDRWASRTHCQIREIDGTLIVKDLASSNGTFVNRNPVSEVALLPGDELAIGITRFEVHY
jgi:pSer/pThr/pTyr-binding forkhead associated (FHA) protein